MLSKSFSALIQAEGRAAQVAQRACPVHTSKSPSSADGDEDGDEEAGPATAEGDGGEGGPHSSPAPPSQPQPARDPEEERRARAEERQKMMSAAREEAKRLKEEHGFDGEADRQDRQMTAFAVPPFPHASALP